MLWGIAGVLHIHDKYLTRSPKKIFKKTIDYHTECDILHINSK